MSAITASPAELIRAALVAAKVGVLPSSATPPVWPVFVGSLPDSPDNAICVYDLEGNTEGRNMRTGRTLTHPGYQVRVRGVDHPTGYTKIAAIQAALDAVYDLEVAVSGRDYTIHSIMQSSGVLSLGEEPDGKRRNGFTLNGTIT